MTKTVFDVLKEKIEEDKAAAMNFLGGGGVKDFAQYKEVTGLIRGLNASLSYITDLSQNYLRDDDD